ncbi:MAG: carbon starvation protein A, partial [Treponemataceae bacterium]|nr:carbon starvation protein A [Treponemataceae bacterium]
MALIIILAAIALLLVGYVFYGSWLAKQWGIDPTKATPAKTMADGVDYVEAKPAVLMGHHFSSIAGAGPINGPIQAAIFGWVPVFLWCVIGGIFFGGVHDFGALFASIRHDGKSVGEIIQSSMGKKSKKLFIIFALLVLILVIASFVNVVAGTFFSADGAKFGFTANPTNNQTTALISVLFIILAVVYGILTNKCGMKVLPATIIGIAGIIGIVILGLNVGFVMNRTAWIIFVSLYIAVASLIPVWIMLQPRDYLSSFLLYAMIAIAIVGILIGSFTGSATFEIPAFAGWKVGGSFIFPTLFITVACGACSGFHSLIASGTTSKQLDSEKNAKAIGYGSMLIESALGIISLIAVGVVWANKGKYGSPSAIFGAGIATLFGA